MPSSCGSCPRLGYHSDLRGHEPDPACGHGPPVAEIAVRLAFALVGGHLLGGASAARVGLRAARIRAGWSAECPLLPVGSRRFRTWCWIRADPGHYRRRPAAGVQVLRTYSAAVRTGRRRGTVPPPQQRAGPSAPTGPPAVGDLAQRGSAYCDLHYRREGEGATEDRVEARVGRAHLLAFIEDLHELPEVGIPPVTARALAPLQDRVDRSLSRVQVGDRDQVRPPEVLRLAWARGGPTNSHSSPYFSARWAEQSLSHCSRRPMSWYRD